MNYLIRNNLTLFLTFYRLCDKCINHQVYGMWNDYIWPIFSLWEPFLPQNVTDERPLAVSRRAEMIKHGDLLKELLGLKVWERRWEKENDSKWVLTFHQHWAPSFGSSDGSGYIHLIFFTFHLKWKRRKQHWKTTILVRMSKHVHVCCEEIALSGQQLHGIHSTTLLQWKK